MTMLFASHTVPSVFEGIANTVGVIVLLLEFGMLRAPLFRAQVRLYAGQSLTISARGLLSGGVLSSVAHLANFYKRLTVWSVSVVLVDVPADRWRRARGER